MCLKKVVLKLFLIAAQIIAQQSILLPNIFNINIHKNNIGKGGEVGFYYSIALLICRLICAKEPLKSNTGIYFLNAFWIFQQSFES